MSGGEITVVVALGVLSMGVPPAVLQSRRGFKGRAGLSWMLEGAARRLIALGSMVLLYVLGTWEVGDIGVRPEHPLGSLLFGALVGGAFALLLEPRIGPTSISEARLLCRAMWWSTPRTYHGQLLGALNCLLRPFVETLLIIGVCVHLVAQLTGAPMLGVAVGLAVSLALSIGFVAAMWHFIAIRLVVLVILLHSSFGLVGVLGCNCAMAWLGLGDPLENAKWWREQSRLARLATAGGSNEPNG